MHIVGSFMVGAKTAWFGLEKINSYRERLRTEMLTDCMFRKNVLRFIVSYSEFNDPVKYAKTAHTADSSGQAITCI